jgi:hypothetical protein
VALRSLFAGLVVCGLIVAGCGSSSSSSPSPLTTELSYFAADSPLVMSITTEPKANAVRNEHQLVGSKPLLSFGESALFSKLRQLGINYDSDIQPLFGNPLVAGIAQLPSAGAKSQFLAAWITNDADALKGLVDKLKPGLQQVGTHDGATLYQLGDLGLAIDDATIVVASTQQQLTAALDRHANGGGISGADYSRAIAGLPQNSLIEAFGSLGGVLSEPQAASARKVPWVRAIRGYAAAVNASSTGLTVQYRVDTSGAKLAPAQLPFAGGSTAPSFAGSMPVVTAVRDPAQAFAFIESAEQSTDPASYQKFLARQAGSQRKTGVDLNSLLHLLTGDAIIDSDTHTTMGRIGVSDAAAAKTTLSKLASHRDGVFKNATSIKRLPGGFYEVKQGARPLTIGLVGDQLVLGEASQARLRAFAAAPQTPAPGAQGAVAWRVALGDVIRLASKRTPAGIQATILKMVGDVTGWSSVTPAALTGSATLAVK